MGFKLGSPGEGEDGGSHRTPNQKTPTRTAQSRQATSTRSTQVRDRGLDSPGIGGAVHTPSGGLKCLYTNAHSMENKQEELAFLLANTNPYIVELTETWWDPTHDWVVNIKGYWLYRQDRKGRKGGDVALYVKEQYTSSANSIRPEVGQTEVLWVRIQGGQEERDLTVGVYYRPPNQGEELDQEFSGQLANAVIMGDLNYLDICWEEQSARSDCSHRFLAELQNLHLTQEVHSPTRGNALLDLVLATGDDLLSRLQVRDHLGDSDHRLLEFTIQRRVSKACSKAADLDFRRADFNEVRRLVREALTSRRGRDLGVQDEWSFLKEMILQAQRVTIATQIKGSKSAQKPPWLTKSTQECLKAKKEAYTQWKGGAITKEDYTSIA
ncbi:uncharacterized protein LOC132250144 [Alligator mississippiensis]|uniref:uncharacterized protein LOC132250144 n=1 Tax=Alligator mississippiensis TaxID=8496 RepID=UPI002877DF8C|nr:uncharacterized protein LOC132250144 [Alligator mississippiensis]